MKTLITSPVISSMLLLSGCNLDLLDPSGVIARSEEHLLIYATLLMLIIVIPTIILAFVFTWRYRKNNKKAIYAPSWSHSTLIEITCWTIPCLIIAILVAMTWISTHELDPYRSLKINQKPIFIQAVALDWKWLFIYPEQNLATVNYVEMPVNAPIRFFVTADAPMNALEMPRIAGQIYAMPGMRTKLNVMATKLGTYRGLSTSYSGSGFSGMHFNVHVRTQSQFLAWVEKAKKSQHELNATEYQKLRKPSTNNPVQFFSSPEKNLFQKIIMKYTGSEIRMSY